MMDALWLGVAANENPAREECVSVFSFPDARHRMRLCRWEFGAHEGLSTLWAQAVQRAFTNPVK